MCCVLDSNIHISATTQWDGPYKKKILVLLHDSQTLLIKAATLTVLTFVLYGCKTWVSHMDASSRVFRSTVLRKTWVYEKRGNRGLEKTAYRGASPYVVLTKHC